MKECKRKFTQEAKENSCARNATETQKAKPRARNATETQKAKSQARNSSETQKSMSRDRKNTEFEKEKCRKRKSTDSEKAKCCERNSYAAKKLRKDNKTRVSAFHEAIRDGPYFICVVCNRTLYKRTVKYFYKNSYNPNIHHVFTNVHSLDSNYYICVTCDKHLKKGEIPCQAVWNKLEISDLPADIKVLNQLEKVLISKRILFKKIVVMPKGQQPKIKGAICNISILVEAVNNCLPQGTDSNGLLFVKPKRKLIYRGIVLFENVRPDVVRDALQYLRNSNPFYSDILIRIDNISTELLSLSDADAIVDRDEFPLLVDNNDSNEDKNLESENL